MQSYSEFIEMKRANIHNCFCTPSYSYEANVLIIRSPRASPAFKCECETSSTLSSYIFFSPRRIKGGVNW